MGTWVRHDLKIRISADLKVWLAARASNHEGSMNGEIIAILKTVRDEGWFASPPNNKSERRAE
jgi:hypothetical protein